MNLDKIKEVLEDFLKEKHLKLFEITYRKSDLVLSVLLDETLNMEELEKISGEISDLLDRYEDELPDNYFLDVSTVGVERPIRNEEELKGAVGKYIYVKTKDAEYYGTLHAYADGILSLDVRDKTRTKNVSLEYAKTKKVRYAVEF